MPNVTCTKCNKKGSLVKKQTKSKGYSYEYWYVEHWTGTKRTWCYIGKAEDLPKNYRKHLKLEAPADTQTDTQTIRKPNKSQASLVSQNNSGYSLVWLGHQPATLTTRVQIPVAAPPLQLKHSEQSRKIYY